MKRYTPQEMLAYGRKLIADAREEYLSMQQQGYDKDEAYWSAFEGICTSNFDSLAVIWAAGAVSLALNSEDVRTAIDEGILD